MTTSNNTTKQQDILNRLIKSTLEAETAHEVAKDALIVAITDGMDNEDKAIITVRERLIEAFELTEKAHVLYDNQLLELQALNVTWQNITHYLQTVVFKGDYPIQEDKDNKPLPVMKAVKADHYCAKIINRFNSYRQSSVCFGCRC